MNLWVQLFLVFLCFFAFDLFNTWVYCPFQNIEHLGYIPDSQIRGWENLGLMLMNFGLLAGASWYTVSWILRVEDIVYPEKNREREEKVRLIVAGLKTQYRVLESLVRRKFTRR